MSKKQTVDFGFEEVTPQEKTEKVAAVFTKVSHGYDLMNDAMTLGLHRIWKRIAIDYAQVNRGDCVLDLAAGTGDLTYQLCRAVGARGQVIMSDINEAMLQQGYRRFLDRGHCDPLQVCLANAEALPFKSDHFDAITLAFGLRNMTDKAKALGEARRVLKPGGRLVVLEFSKALSPMLAKIYDRYSFDVIPKIGEWLLGDRDSYQYLVESIRRHPDQAQLKQMFKAVGFDEVGVANLMGGIVAIHWGVTWQ